MNPLPDSETCPVDLDFPESSPARLDVGQIAARGGRIRRRRRLTAAGSVIVACAAVASIITGAHGGTFRWFPPPTVPAQPGGRVAPPSAGAWIAADPPATGKLTLLGRRPAGWTTVAWATRGGDVCWTTYPARASYGDVDFECPSWSRAEVRQAARGGLSGQSPGMWPPPDRQGRLVPWLGLVTPQAVRVTVTFFGAKFSAGVAPVPLGSGRNIGAYLIWLRLPPGTTSYGGNDWGPVVAYDAQGHVIARQGPGQ
jgi:hypothetical protein